MATEHQLSSAGVHYTWDNAIPPRLSMEPGDILIAETRDSSDRYYSADSSHADVARKGPLQGHPLTGPVFMRGAEPGDTLVVDILDVTPAANFGWTAIRPGKGLLPIEEFPRHFLQIWDLSDTRLARMPQRRDIAVPIAPFPGIVGTALGVAGPHSTIPPRENGGNMDVQQMQVGTTLLLPCFVDGCGLFVGDVHYAQGDGEVSGTAIEMGAVVTVRTEILEGGGSEITGPHFEGADQLKAIAPGKFYATVGFPLKASGEVPPYHTYLDGQRITGLENLSEDLTLAARYALLDMIEYIEREHGLTREQAYVLSSVAVDLVIGQVVDVPNYTVSAILDLEVFE
jgi:formamidase